MGLGAVEVEVAYGHTVVIARDIGVDRLADDTVHAGKGADIDYAVGPLVPEVDSLADTQDHLAHGAVGRDIWFGKFQEKARKRLRNLN